MKVIRISAIWCTSCILTYSTWEELKRKYPDYEYEEYDYDMDQEKIKQYKIGKVLPVIIAIRDDGDEIRIIGEKKLKEIEEQLKEKA